MNYINIINSIFKYFFINIFTCYIYQKILCLENFKKKEKFSSVLICLILSINDTYTFNGINSIAILFLSAILLGIMFCFFTKSKLDYSIIITLLSLIIAVSIYQISIFFILIIIHAILPKINIESPIFLIISMLMESIFLNILFKIKRFKNGFSFLKDENKNYNILLFFAGILFFIIFGYKNYKNNTNSFLLITSMIIMSISLFIWIKRKITLYYKSLLIEDTIKNLKEELEKEEKLNEDMQEELNKIATINHKFSSRISALELYIEKLSHNPNDVDKQKVEEAEFSSELIKNINTNEKITRTGILNIDNLLDYFNDECINKNISFNVLVKNNIKNIVKNTIPLNLLETLLADMIKNAVIAIGYNNKKENKILVQFDKKEDLEIRIWDTGIEFEKGTLMKLGKERITTHKEDGGSGIGFVTTFETLNKTKASLIIEEYDNDEYTKCLVFKFDNKNNYIIRSYRSNQFDNLDNDERIFIEPVCTNIKNL